MKKHSLKIIKIPSPSKTPLYRQEFISQPTNYLKIIENPDKIKVEQLARDFDIKEIKNLDTRRLVYPNPEPFIPPPPKTIETKNESPIHVKTTPPKPPRPINNISKYKFEVPIDSDEEDDYEILKTPERPEPQQILTPPKPPHIPTPQITPQHTPQHTPQITPQHTPQYTPMRTPSLLSPKSYTAQPPQPIYQDEYNPQTPPRTENNIHSRLHNFLTNYDSGGESDNESNTSYTYRNRKTIDPYKYMSRNQRDFTKQHYEPPTLDELEKNGEYVAQPQFLQAQQLDELYNIDNHRDDDDDDDLPFINPNTQQMYIQPVHHVEEEDNESIDDKKRDLIINMALLKKKYPKQAESITEINMQTPYNDMKSIYNLELKKLEIEYSVDNYRKYLIGGFMLIEYILGKFLRIDLEGFTQQQIINLQQYEVLLIELGEKKYMPDSKKWPVEIRLTFMIFIQAAIFTVSKLIMQRTGSNLLSMFNDAMPQQTNKKKVKRPDINFDDL